MVLKPFPKVTIIIPHWNGEEILRRCLLSLRRTRYPEYRILVVDNGSEDGSIPRIRKQFPEADMIHSEKNIGFAAGCNLGICSSDSPYVVLLNNDTEVTAGWLSPMVQAMEQDVSIAGAQPKLLSIRDRKQFDYCGAAGGEMDIFGYPFAWGRIFDYREKDHGQYDTQKTIFWASGAATLLRRTVLDTVGLMDEKFFAHMEEIDLNWRMQMAGYRIVSVPQAVVYHQTGATLHEKRIRKMVLNHRNSLMMIIKNYSMLTLMWLLPLRLILEGLTILAFLFKGQPKRSLSVILGLGGILVNGKSILKNRRQAQKIRRMNDTQLMRRMYRGSIALMHYLKGIQETGRLHFK